MCWFSNGTIFAPLLYFCIWLLFVNYYIPTSTLIFYYSFQNLFAPGPTHPPIPYPLVLDSHLPSSECPSLFPPFLPPPGRSCRGWWFLAMVFLIAMFFCNFCISSHPFISFWVSASNFDSWASIPATEYC